MVLKLRLYAVLHGNRYIITNTEIRNIEVTYNTDIITWNRLGYHLWKDDLQEIDKRKKDK